ncbi:MAG: hypothetical protein RJR37_02550 [Peptococcaceae bacterium MAG4]|nr:hypothetical protein [Peptococcaceae bacterium MAG4]
MLRRTSCLAADLSYRKSGQVIGEQCGKVSISGQTVKRAVDTFENPTLPKRERKPNPIHRS